MGRPRVKPETIGLKVTSFCSILQGAPAVQLQGVRLDAKAGALFDLTQQIVGENNVDVFDRTAVQTG